MTEPFRLTLAPAEDLPPGPPIFPIDGIVTVEKLLPDDYCAPHHGQPGFRVLRTTHFDDGSWGVHLRFLTGQEVCAGYPAGTSFNVTRLVDENLEH